MSSPVGTNLLIFADGACSGNPGRGGWGSIVATPQGQVLELGGSSPSTTNNQMELTAAIEALRKIEAIPGEVDLYTDSVYLIKGITQWIWAWQRKGWMTAEGNEVSNQDLWKRLSGILYGRKKNLGEGSKVNWLWVRGHSGVPGNERVDEIAVQFRDGQRPHLYQGPLLKYPVAIYDVPESGALPESSNSPKREKAKAYSYLSLVGTIATRHTTWAECERRVKGQSGAKFKKTSSAEEEEKILRSWGVDPARVKT